MPWRWRTGRGTGRPDDSSERVLLLEARCQQLTLDAAARERDLARVTADLERERAARRSDDAAHRSVGRVLDALAAPAVQVLTLAHLHESQGVEPRLDDVLAAALRLVRALERCGVQVVSAVGEDVAYDPALHDPLSTATALRTGQPAVVRVVGLAHDGRVLRKAGVEAAG